MHAQPVSPWQRLGFTQIPPKNTCLEELLARVSAQEFADALSPWVQDGLELDLEDEELSAISIDGKTLRGTLTEHQRAVHLLSALDHKLSCVLSQMPVDTKTNEHKATMELLDSLVLEGTVIVGDAMFCQRELCEKTRDRGGHYFFIVKRQSAGAATKHQIGLREHGGLFSLTSRGNMRPNGTNTKPSRSRAAASSADG